MMYFARSYAHQLRATVVNGQAPTERIFQLREAGGGVQ